MATSIQYRQQEGSLGGMMVMEKDDHDDLSLFLEMRDSNIEEMNNPSLVHGSQEFDDLLELKPESSLISEIMPTINGSETQADDLLNIENSKNDYEWLLAPPDNPVIPSVEKEAADTAASQSLNTNGRVTIQQPRVANPAAKPASGTSKSSNRSASSNAGIRRPSPSRGPPSTSSRSTTPAGRPILPSTTKPSRSSTPTSRATLPSSTKPMAPPKRSSTPTMSSARSSTPTARSSTPTARSSTPTARSSTPTARPSAPATSKSISRSSTPTHRPSAPSSVPATSGLTGRSSSVTKTRVTAVPSRGNSPSVKSRPSKNPIETSLPEKSASESRGRPIIPIVKVSSTDTNSNGRQRRDSCSPSRGKLSNGSASNNVRSSIGRARGYSDSNDDVNPVLMGTKMVERVVNMRKLAPPKQDDHFSNQNSSSEKSSSSQNNSGFGRSLSKKSFDMALRHMDIRRSMPGNLRAMITKVPASSVYSVRSDSTKSRTVSASDSPHATSSNASSSELSLSNNSHGSTEAGDNDFRSSEVPYDQ